MIAAFTAAIAGVAIYDDGLSAVSKSLPSKSLGVVEEITGMTR